MRGWGLLAFLSAAAAAEPEPVLLTGLLEAFRSRDVYAPLSEVVTQIAVHVGDSVAAGDTLACLAAEDLRLIEDEARVAYLKVKARLNRAEPLYAEGGLSTQALETVRYETEAARIRWHRARRDRDRAVVRAPIAGQVVECLIHVGTFTAPRMRLFRIIASDTLKTELFIPANQVKAVQVEQAVIAWPKAAPEQRLQGSIVRVSPVLDPESGTCQVQALFPGVGDSIKPGTVVRVQIGAE